jgi:hypothetical protein
MILEWNKTYCHVQGIRLTKINFLDRMIGFIGASLQLHLIKINTALTLTYTLSISLGFSVSTSRILAMDLNTGTITSNHYEVFLLFLLQSHSTPLS